MLTTPPITPPPWQLHGHGYILFFLAQPSPQPPFRGGVGAVMLVEYTDTPVGPYHELLFIPGFYAVGGRSYPSISKIYVSSETSVRDGRANWYIPKELAQFARYPDGQTERWVINSPTGELIADVTLHQKRLTLPLTTAVVPPRFRTIIQPSLTDPTQPALLTTLSGHGRLRPAQLLWARTNPALFPDFVGLARGGKLTAVAIPHFTLTFPVADTAV
jgi:hypothetical protein